MRLHHTLSYRHTSESPVRDKIGGHHAELNILSSNVVCSTPLQSLMHHNILNENVGLPAFKTLLSSGADPTIESEDQISAFSSGILHRNYVSFTGLDHEPWGI